MAAQKLNLSEVPCITLKGLSEAQKKAYIIADNQLPLNAGWDLDKLKLEVETLKELDFNVDLLGFDDDFLDGLLDVQTDGLTDEDSVPELPETPVSVLGDIWQLGNHRLMCGDSTSIDAVEKLMDGYKTDMVFTDPPYGINYKSNYSKRFDEIKNDDTFLDIRPVIEVVREDICAMYIWTSHQVYHIWREMFNDIYKSTIIWYKKFGGMGDLKAEYGHNYEICIYSTTDRIKFKGARPKAVWEIGVDDSTKFVHPTQKPVALAENAISHHSCNRVLDLFLGSGSTLIACEKTNRKCFGMELDEKFVDVIIKRWENFTGKQAVHIESGKTYEELKGDRDAT
jgi:DNA modification methylase